MKDKNESRAEDPGDLDPRCEEYLWDPKAPADADVEQLERLLALMRLDPQMPIADAAAWNPRGKQAGTHSTGRARLLVGILTLGGLAAAVLLGLQLSLGDSQVLEEPAQQVSLTTESGRVLRASSTFVAQRDGERLLLGKDGRLADLELTRGSRLAIRSLRLDQTVLALQEGKMDAFVSAEAKPGFFNVDTPSTRCVDLGCQYRLTVDADGKAHVRVQLGRVAFRDERKPWRDEVFVPQGANCTADPRLGSGTPRYDDLDPALSSLLDGFDALPAKLDVDRRDLATAFIEKAELKEDMLPVWHFLQDLDPVISRMAAAKLLESYGPIPGLKARSDAVKDKLPNASERALWREFLWPDPYK